MKTKVARRTGTAAMPAAAARSAHHVSVTVVQDGRPVGYHLLDLRTDYPPLLKELAWRAVAAEPSAAGARWVPTVRVVRRGPSSPHVVLEAHRTEDDGGPACSRPLAALDVPASTFHWVASGIADAVQAAGQWAYVIAAQGPDSKVVADWNASGGDGDFELLTEGEPELTLPSAFSTATPPQPRRVIAPAGSWLRCAFERPAFVEFLDAAAAETQKERSWLGLGRVCLAPDACRVVIEGDLVALPGEAGREWIVTRGRDWARLHDRLGERLVAFLHLHPPTVNGEPLTPEPSRNDAVVAWNLSLAAAAPVVYPIAMFGARADSPGGDVAAYGHEGGLLRPIQLEVLP